MSILTQKKKPTSSADLGIQTYRSKKGYAEQMRIPTQASEKYNGSPMPESEFAKPYQADSYTGMEYNIQMPGGIIYSDPKRPGRYTPKSAPHTRTPGAASVEWAGPVPYSPFNIPERYRYVPRPPVPEEPYVEPMPPFEPVYWEPWGGALSANHTWQFLEEFSDIYGPLSVSANPIYRFNASFSDYSQYFLLCRWGATYSFYDSVSTSSVGDEPFFGTHMDNSAVTFKFTPIIHDDQYRYIQIIFLAEGYSSGLKGPRLTDYEPDIPHTVCPADFVSSTYKTRDFHGIGIRVLCNSGDLDFSINYIDIEKI